MVLNGGAGGGCIILVIGQSIQLNGVMRLRTMGADGSLLSGLTGLAVPNSGAGVASVGSTTFSSWSGGGGGGFAVAVTPTNWSLTFETGGGTAGAVGGNGGGGASAQIRPSELDPFGIYGE